LMATGRSHRDNLFSPRRVRCEHSIETDQGMARRPARPVRTQRERPEHGQRHSPAGRRLVVSRLRLRTAHRSGKAR
jgi:hypothetical protein